MDIITGIFPDEFIQETFADTCRQEGEEKKAKEIACSLAIDGFSPAAISKYVHIAVETVTQWLVDEGIIKPAPTVPAT